MNNIIYNGRLINSDQPLFFATNRSFRYGDGLFESMRFIQGQIPFLERHIDRLQSGMRYLGFENPERLNRQTILSGLQQLKLPEFARIRLAVCRKAGGTYTPITDKFDYILEVSNLQKEKYLINQEGLIFGLYKELGLQGNSLENLKTANRLPQVLASRFAAKMNYDDVLLFHQSGQVAEATASNVFVIKGQEILSPPLSSGCLAGIIREVILETVNTVGFKVGEKALYFPQDFDGGSVFITNSIKGIQWVQNIDGIEFEKGPVDRILEHLNQKSNS